MGSHILEALIKINHQELEIVAACRDPSKLINQYSGEVRQGDLRDPDYLDRVLVGIDVICHAAGQTSFIKSADSCSENYLEPTIDLINRAIEWRVSRFINLSSIYTAAVKERNNASSIGKPRAYWPMINCHIAVEEYLRNYQKPRCQFINLRLGLYAGKRLNMGLLPLLLTRSNKVKSPYLIGQTGYLPLIDGRDIGQAFTRAALGPFESDYNCLNITGPETPSQAEIMTFLEQQIHIKPLSFGLPSLIASPMLWWLGKIHSTDNEPLFTSAMINMLKCPPIDNQSASLQIGYDPEISWKASLMGTLEDYKNQTLNTNIKQSARPLNL